MSRQTRRNTERDNPNTKKALYISGAILLVAVLAFVISFIVYGNQLDKEAKATKFGSEKLASINQNSMVNAMTNTDSSEVSSAIGKSVNEVKEAGNELTNTIEKTAVNTSVQETKVKEQKENKKQEETKKEEKVADPTFTKPVEGEVMKEYAKENLVYSDTLKEWVTHTGIDLKAEKTSIVKASADGQIKSIKNDPRYGLTVVIEHTNGFSSVYANLLTAEFVVVGEKVKQGQTIGTVGNTATFEIADEAHLHFEILKDNVAVDPNMYLK